MSIFEIVMLLCFGMAWPFSIVASWRARRTGSKSVIFLYVVFFGYISGIIHKSLYSRDPVLFLYLLNGLMVAVDIVIYYRNVRLEKQG